MALSGALGDMHEGGDLLVGQALCDVCGDFAFAAGRPGHVTAQRRRQRVGPGRQGRMPSCPAVAATEAARAEASSTSPGRRLEASTLASSKRARAAKGGVPALSAATPSLSSRTASSGRPAAAAAMPRKVRTEPETSIAPAPPVARTGQDTAVVPPPRVPRSRMDRIRRSVLLRSRLPPKGGRAQVCRWRGSRCSRGGRVPGHRAVASGPTGGRWRTAVRRGRTPRASAPRPARPVRSARRYWPGQHDDRHARRAERGAPAPRPGPGFPGPPWWRRRTGPGPGPSPSCCAGSASGPVAAATAPVSASIGPSSGLGLVEAGPPALLTHQSTTAGPTTSCRRHRRPCRARASGCPVRAVRRPRPGARAGHLP